MKNLRSIAKRSLVVLAVAAAAIQFVPVQRTNPPVDGEVPASAEVRAVLRHSCYDCHSNATVWPWYARIAPFSWLVAKDVREAREELNFSTWARLAPRERAHLLQEIRKEVEEGEMPPRLYLLPHPQARLSAADKTILQTWAQETDGGGSAGGRLP